MKTRSLCFVILMVLALTLFFPMRATYSCTCGDSNGDGGVDIADIVHLINYQLRSGPPPVCPVDVDCSQNNDMIDIVYLVLYLFQGGNPPCDPDGNGTPNC